MDEIERMNNSSEAGENPCRRKSKVSGRKVRHLGLVRDLRGPGVSDG